MAADTITLGGRRLSVVPDPNQPGAYLLATDSGQSVMAAAANAVGKTAVPWKPATAAAALTGVAVKASSGNLYGYHLANESASASVYVNFYDHASAATGTPWSLKIPPDSVLDTLNMELPIGPFANGLFVTVSSARDGTGTPNAAPTCVFAIK
jgi:hypothetical protein